MAHYVDDPRPGVRQQRRKATVREEGKSWTHNKNEMWDWQDGYAPICPSGHLKFFPPKERKKEK